MKKAVFFLVLFCLNASILFANPYIPMTDAEGTLIILKRYREIFKEKYDITLANNNQILQEESGPEIKGKIFGKAIEDSGYSLNETIDYHINKYKRRLSYGHSNVRSNKRILQDLFESLEVYLALQKNENASELNVQEAVKKKVLFWYYRDQIVKNLDTAIIKGDDRFIQAILENMEKSGDVKTAQFRRILLKFSGLSGVKQNRAEAAAEAKIAMESEDKYSERRAIYQALLFLHEFETQRSLANLGEDIFKNRKLYTNVVLSQILLKNPNKAIYDILAQNYSFENEYTGRHDPFSLSVYLIRKLNNFTEHRNSYSAEKEKKLREFLEKKLVNGWEKQFASDWLSKMERYHKTDELLAFYALAPHNDALLKSIKFENEKIRASRFAIHSVFNSIKYSGNIDIYSKNNGYSVYFTIDMILENNTHATVEPTKVYFFFVDKQGYLWNDWTTGLRKPIVINKNSRQKLHFKDYLLDAKNIYLIRRMQEGEMFLGFEIIEAKINGRLYTLDDVNIPLRLLENGQWQLANFAPFTLQPLPQWKKKTPQMEKIFKEEFSKAVPIGVKTKFISIPSTHKLGLAIAPSLAEYAGEGNIEAIKKLLDAGTSINLKDSIGTTPLIKAVQKKQVATVKFLLEKGADIKIVSPKGWSPLILSVANRNINIIHLLINNGADINENISRGWTPLRTAARNGDTKIGKMLLEKGARVDMPGNDGVTALISAANSGHLAFVTLLLENKANVHIADKAGLTALHRAVAQGHTHIAKLLLSHGANPKLKDKKGKDALAHAEEKGKLETIELLKNPVVLAKPKPPQEVGEKKTEKEIVVQDTTKNKIPTMQKESENKDQLASTDQQANGDKNAAEKNKQITIAPIVSMSKKPGKAVFTVNKEDRMGLNTFTPDEEKDTCVHAALLNASPLVAVRMENMGGISASWKTKDVKTKATGVLALLQGDTLLNANDASFSLDVSQETSLRLCVQDNGSLADDNTRIRVIFFHKDGSRTYAILQR